MKKLAVTVLLLICLISAGCSTVTVEFTPQPPIATLDAESGYKQWSDTDMTITLTYPHRWYANENVSALVQLLSPDDDATPDYREYIVLGVFENTEDLTVEQVADNAVTDMQGFDSAITLTESGTQTVSGIKMQKRVFGGHTTNQLIGPEDDYIWQQYSWLAGRYSFSITLACTQTMYAQYLDVLSFVLERAELDFSIYN